LFLKYYLSQILLQLLKDQKYLNYQMNHYFQRNPKYLMSLNCH